MIKYPYQSQIKKVELVNFAGTHKIDIAPQTVQFEFYESIFESVQKAILNIYDPIGLFNNFPLIGEEILLVTFENDDDEKTFAYIIDSVDDIRPSKKAREVSFILKLSSLVVLPNLVRRVQQAYHGRVSEIIYNLFNEHIYARLNNMQNSANGVRYALQQATRNFYDFKYENIEESVGEDAGTIIIPNLYPLKAVEWLAKYAVPQDYKKRYQYHFWQANDGFHFQTSQYLCTKPAKRHFKYYSDSEIINKLSAEDQYDAITNLILNNRILSFDKVIDGYFQNGLFEINMAQLSWKITPTTIDDYAQDVENRGYHFKMNTNKFIDTIMSVESEETSTMSTVESMNRVKYTMNNREDFDKVTPLLHQSYTWGNKVRSSSAFSQVDLHIAVQGDSRLAAGDIVEVTIPKMEGFNQGDGNTEDKFIIGRYLVTELKHLITAGGQHTTVLRLNKDTYYTDPDKAEFEYKTEPPNVITPSAGAAKN